MKPESIPNVDALLPALQKLLLRECIQPAIHESAIAATVVPDPVVVDCIQKARSFRGLYGFQMVSFTIQVLLNRDYLISSLVVL